MRSCPLLGHQSRQELLRVALEVPRSSAAGKSAKLNPAIGALACTPLRPSCQHLPKQSNSFRPGLENKPTHLEIWEISRPNPECPVRFVPQALNLTPSNSQPLPPPSPTGGVGLICGVLGFRIFRDKGRTGPGAPAL